ncbi:MAG: PIN domain-containing protein [Desulfuromonadaceae bacterium]
MNVPEKVLCFVDSNIWLYAFIESPGSNKCPIARTIITDSRICISSQIINEVSVNLIKKASFSEESLKALRHSFFSRYTVATEFSEELLDLASALRGSYNFQYWDSLIVASALSLNAEILYSEDMHNGLLVQKKLRIVNPFK